MTEDLHLNTDVSSMTDLPIDHVAHGHADLHAYSLNMVEVEMMKHGQDDGWQGDACSVAVGLMDCSRVDGVISLKVLD